MYGCPSFRLLLFGCLFSKLWSYEVQYATKGVDHLFELNGIPNALPIKKGEKLNSKEYITTGPSAFVEIHHQDITIRLGKNAIAEWVDTRHWKIHEGSSLFCLEEKDSIKVSSTKGSSVITGPCTFIAETTSNGGYKLICLSGRPYVQSGQKKTMGPAGRLVLVLGETNALGNAYDIDLMLLLKSSLLINAFEDPPPTMKKIGLAVYSQQMRMGGKYDALIGDATTDKNLQMWVLGKKGTGEKADK
jgi:hypothetical protein